MFTEITNRGCQMNVTPSPFIYWILESRDRSRILLRGGGTLLEVVPWCAKHTCEMRSMSFLGGSGGMFPQENFENLGAQICNSDKF